MRNITAGMVKAFYEGYTKSNGNTRVYEDKGYWCMSLHGNWIARRPVSGRGYVEVSCAGWPTVTTKERLRGICLCRGAAVWQHKGVWLFTSQLEPGVEQVFDLNGWNKIAFVGTEIDRLVHELAEEVSDA